MSRDLKILTVAGNEAIVHHGVALGIMLSAGSKGTLVVNLHIARAEGANFGVDLLRVARVIRCSQAIIMWKGKRPTVRG